MVCTVNLTGRALASWNQGRPRQQLPLPRDIQYVCTGAPQGLRAIQIALAGKQHLDVSKIGSGTADLVGFRNQRKSAIYYPRFRAGRTILASIDKAHSEAQVEETMWQGMRGGAIIYALGTFLLAQPSLADFPDSAPNDPQFGKQYTLLGDIPLLQYPLATDPESAAGMSVVTTWQDHSLNGARTGRPDILVAYLEGGINWNAGDLSKDLVNKVYLNCGELPAPQDKQGKTHAGSSPGCKQPDMAYDLNGDGIFNIQDYAADPRVSDRNGNGFLDPEDLIAIFSDGHDDDGNGYVDDISGWDFYNNQNDPATLDATYLHSDTQMGKAAAEANNGINVAGICARCMLLPVKVGAEALDRADDLSRGLLYAADRGAKVVITENAALGYSSFEREAIEYLWRHDVLVSETTNDFNSTDHQGSMYWPHDVTGNAFVRDFGASTVQDIPDSNLLTTTFRTRSEYTSWGPKNLVTVETLGGTTSEATGTLGGVLGAVRSCALEFSPASAPYTGPEILQTIIATASDTDGTYVKWPTRPGWDLQTGYGRPNIHKACIAFRDGTVPPVAWLDAPEWFTLLDPTATGAVEIDGAVSAVRSPSYTWTLEYGLGAEPDVFTPLSNGGGQTPYEGKLGVFDPAQVPATFWQHAFALSQYKQLETTQQYTVTLRLRIADASGRTAEERRAIEVYHDPSWFAGFPMRVNRTGMMDGRFSPGGESQPKLVDLQGLGHLQIVYADADGLVHDLDPLSRVELPGWPVATDLNTSYKAYDGVDARHEPFIASVAVGDLDHDGHLWVVGTSTTGKVYVWDEQGRRRAGFPQALNLGLQAPPVPRKAANYSRPPKQGAFAAPVLYDLFGDGKLEIIQAAWDGYIHVFNGDGSEAKGWPQQVLIPDSLTPNGYVRIHDYKLQVTPVIADLDGDGKPEIVVRTQQNDTKGSDIQFVGQLHLTAFHADGTPVAGWPDSVPSLVEYYGSAQEFVTEGAEGLAAADVDGDGKDEIAVNPLFSPAFLLSGNGQVRNVLGLQPNIDLGALLAGTAGLNQLLAALPADVPVGFTTSGAFGKVGGGMTYAQSGAGVVSVAGSLLFPASGIQLKNFERIVDANTGLPRTLSAPFMQGLDFLSSPLFVDVDGDGVPEIVDGGDSNALHAFNAASGAQAAGFPKFQTGWMVWSASAGDLDGDGRTELVATTREGYVFVWKTNGIASGNHEWWTYHHDEWNSGRYGVDTRPPGVVRGLATDAGSHALKFMAPGDDWYAGKPAGYIVQDRSGRYTLPASASAGEIETLSVPATISSGTIQAVDAAGNLGRPVNFDFSSGSSSSGGGGSSSGNSTGSSGGGGAVPPGALLVGLLVLMVRRLRPLALR